MAKRGSSALQRVLSSGAMSADLANYLLGLNFDSQDHARYRALSKKAQTGTLTDKESVELDDLLTANDILTILQSKARISLRKQASAPEIS